MAADQATLADNNGMAAPDAGAGGGAAPDHAARGAFEAEAGQGLRGESLEFRPGEAAAPAQPAAPPAGASGVARAGAPADAWTPLPEVLQSLGWRPGREYATDQEILADILGELRQAQDSAYYAQLGRQLAPHTRGIEQYLRGQAGVGAQPAAAAPAPAPRPEWEPPEFDPAWLQLVDRDPRSGVFLARPGVNPELADRVNAYDRWYQRYGANPVAAVRPMLEAELPRMMGDLVKRELAEHRRQQSIDDIIRRNAAWMYQQQQGRAVADHAGRPVPTPEGARYMQFVRQLEAGGMADPEVVDRLACDLVRGEWAWARHAQAQAQGQGGRPRAAEAAGRPQAGAVRSLPGSQRAAIPGAPEPEPDGPGVPSLVQMLREAASDLTDDDFEDPDFLRG